MSRFFQASYSELVDSPNGLTWWHSMPLPDGRRINGNNPNKQLQLSKWNTLQIPAAGGLAGKRVLDIGANDGYFSLAALAAGAQQVTAINSADWDTYPTNIRHAAEVWGFHPEILTGDFRTYPFEGTFDVVFFLGVLYHLEDVFSCMKLLRRLLAPRGVLYIETQMSKVESDLPIFEYASDIYPTVAIQAKQALDRAGISNYLFPNEPAMNNLAYSYDFTCKRLGGPADPFTVQYPIRGVFKLTRQDESTAEPR